jgi:diguanylate cyclase (GGDEF)-like protein
MTRPRSVLLIARNSQKCAMWRHALAGVAIDAFPPGEISNGSSPDDLGAIVADHPIDLQQLNIPVQRLDRGEIGLVMVGHALPADVQLPADATPRELVLACRMLLQVVHQRRKLIRFERQQKLLRQAAATDSLTGLANRRAWDEMWQQLQNSPFNSATAKASVTVIALFDVDRFKRWNDELGHALADQQLISVAERLSTAVRRGDFVFRWGGDEFALLLNDVPANKAGELVEQIRQAAGLEATRTVTLSAGWSILANHDGRLQPTTAFKQADEALRSAKAAGGNRSFPK